MSLSFHCTLESSRFYPRQSDFIHLELDPGAGVFKSLPGNSDVLSGLKTILSDLKVLLKVLSYASEPLGIA